MPQRLGLNRNTTHVHYLSGTCASTRTCNRVEMSYFNFWSISSMQNDRRTDRLGLNRKTTHVSCKVFVRVRVLGRQWRQDTSIYNQSVRWTCMEYIQWIILWMYPSITKILLKWFFWLLWNCLYDTSPRFFVSYFLFFFNSLRRTNKRLWPEEEPRLF